MKIYMVDAEDLMNSTFSNDRVVLGYFKDSDKASRVKEAYDEKLSKHLKAAGWSAVIHEIEVES